MVRLGIIPMRHPAPWMAKQCTIAGASVPIWYFNGLKTHAQILENEKLKKNKKKQTIHLL